MKVGVGASVRIRGDGVRGKAVACKMEPSISAALLPLKGCSPRGRGRGRVRVRVRVRVSSKGEG